MRSMWDADNPYDIPRNAEMVAGYVDGSRTKWTQEMWDRFPNAVKVRISAVGATLGADVFDVEPGCIWPPENVIPLVVAARARGGNPTVYCNEMNHWAYIRRMFQDRDIPEPPYWVANYDMHREVPAGAVAKQYMHPPQTGKHYDLSAVADFWPGVDKVEEDVSYGIAVKKFAPSNGEYVEDDVVFPHRGGDTGVTDVYVTLFCPGMPFDENQVREVLNLRYTHFVDDGGNIVGTYFPDDEVMHHHEAGPGVRVPDNAVKLVVQYDSPVGLQAITEVKASA